jgi:hypothetical protein
VADQYPFVLSNNRIGPLLDALATAAKPVRFTQEFLRSLGFVSSNDRAFIPLFRKLGFITSDGVPTEDFDALRVKETRGSILADKLRELYADLFAINTNIQDSNDTDLRGAISRLTGKDALTVQRYATTFKTLAGYADFKAKSVSHKPSPADQPPPAKTPDIQSSDAASNKPRVEQRLPHQRATEFHYNIQIHLPATSDVSIYNAIFRSLKENLGV